MQRDIQLRNAQTGRERRRIKFGDAALHVQRFQIDYFSLGKMFRGENTQQADDCRNVY